MGREGDAHAAAYVALKYYQHAHECFSAWSPDEPRAFSEFNRKLATQTWPQVYRSAGGDKSGLGYTPHGSGGRLPRPEFLRELSEDISFFELRVTQKARVHGFRAGAAFFLVFLDRSHRLFPG